MQLFIKIKCKGLQPLTQGLKFTVGNVQFATGSRTFAPNKNNLGANLLLQLLAHFRNKYIFCSLLEQVYS